MYKKIIICILIVSLVTGLVGCNNSSKNKVSEIKEKGKIVLGTAADYPPYEFHKSINGKDEIVGFDIELAKHIAKDLGVELEVIDMKFDGLLPALVTGDIDFILAGMVPTPEREKTIGFSQTYYKAKQRMVVRSEDSKTLKTPDDFKTLKIGAQKSTTQESVAIEKFPDSEIIALSKLTDLVLELTNNKIDALVLAQPVAEAYVSQNPDLHMPEIILGEEAGVAVAIDKKNTDLIDLINGTLDRLIKDGSIDKLIQEATELAN